VEIVAGLLRHPSPISIDGSRACEYLPYVFKKPSFGYAGFASSTTARATCSARVPGQLLPRSAIEGHSGMNNTNRNCPRFRWSEARKVWGLARTNF
jgi:hypothetical protein